MPIGIVRTGWQGTTGGPGLTQMAMGGSLEGFGDWDATAAQAAVNAVRAFWDAVKGVLPNDLTLTVSPVVDVYATAQGDLVGSYQAATPPTNVVGTQAGVFSMASGVKMQWNTGIIRNGRRVRGATFLVPAASTAFTDGGIVSSTTRTTLNSAGTTLMAATATANNPFGVWSRPTTTESNDGAWALIVGAEAVEKGAVLRGRRD